MRNVYEDAALLRKLFTGEANEEEQEKAKALLENPAIRKMYDGLGDDYAQVHTGSCYSAESGFEAFGKKAGLDGNHTFRRKYRLILYRVVGVAAMLLLAVGLWTLWPDREVSRLIPAIELNPGDTKGRLILADGREVEVNKGKDVTLASKQAIVSYKDNCLSYQRTEERLDEQEVQAYNQFVIPYGGENTLLLADGTKVRLNAASKLIYPEYFTGNQRVVFLDGEAYFDVARDDKHPFIVQTRLGEIQVMGTSFNVNIYPENEACYTTLVEGKVRVTSPTHERIMLKPNEQAVVSDKALIKREVDVEEYVGWINGIYVFKNKPLKEIMETFERWYNIKVHYEDEALASIKYTGNVKRYESIVPFLEALQLTVDLRYQIKGREVYIGK